MRAADARHSTISDPPPSVLRARRLSGAAYEGAATDARLAPMKTSAQNAAAWRQSTRRIHA